MTGIERADGAGHGLVGMRERMSAWGGTLEVGSRPDHGFRVHGVIPTHQSFSNRQSEPRRTMP